MTGVGSVPVTTETGPEDGIGLLNPRGISMSEMMGG